MSGKVLAGAVAALLMLARPVAAAEVDVRDAHGHPLGDAVVELAPEQREAPQAASLLPAEGVIDQRHETFLPLVTLIRNGGRVVFTNNDTTMHQVYSFSQIKQFAFEIDEGRRSEGVVFDKPGVAAIGCNIHDRMITYVYVSEQPWAALSDRDGRAKFAMLPAGSYRGSVWHPQLPPGAPRTLFSLIVSSDGSRAAVAVPVSAAPAKKSMHMQMY
jgi:plastocyanin